MATNPQAPGMTKITFQVSEGEKAELTALAKASGVKLSAYLRFIVQDAIATRTQLQQRLARTNRLDPNAPQGAQIIYGFPSSPADQMIVAEDKQHTAAPAAESAAHAKPSRSHAKHPARAKK